MGWLVTVAKAIGAVLKEILPIFLEEMKKQKKVKPIGNDKDLQDDINRNIEGGVK